ncbi:MAG: Spy/CpxP family protein refolding chaperone [Candidatus Obscuribacterales bacterium]|nr:Spy/CpxP family protein refolding chaperone [Candidatus Obscuribacterales bacterium]
MKKLLSILTLSSVFTLSGTAFAQDFSTAEDANEMFSGQVPGEELASLPIVPPADEEIIAVGAASPAQGMNLTDEQLEKIHVIKNSFKDSASKKVADLKTLQRQLRSTLLEEKVDRAKATDLQAKINGLKNDLSSARLAMKLDTYDVLTGEQKLQMRHRALQKEAFGRCGGEGRKGHGANRMQHRRPGLQKQAQT